MRLPFVFAAGPISSCAQESGPQHTAQRAAAMSSRPGRTKLEEARKYHLRIKNKSVITLKNPNSIDQPYIGKVVGIESDNRSSQTFLKLQWYYHPEESNCGRQTFHGSKVLPLAAPLILSLAWRCRSSFFRTIQMNRSSSV